MSNIKSIINHFTPKIDAWSTANHVSSLTEEQVLEIVRTNYDSLTLKLEDDLDQYDRYNENPNETNFFATLVSILSLSFPQLVKNFLLYKSNLAKTNS